MQDRASKHTGHRGSRVLLRVHDRLLRAHTETQVPQVWQHSVRRYRTRNGPWTTVRRSHCRQHDVEMGLSSQVSDVPLDLTIDLELVVSWLTLR